MRKVEISAVIPVRDGEEETAACWRIGERTILEIAIQKLDSVLTGVSRVFVAGRSLKGVLRMPLDPRVLILDADIPPLLDKEDVDPMGSVRALACSVAGPVHELQEGDCHLMVLDPLRPLISAADIHTAVHWTLALGSDGPGRTGVIAVSRVRNHHHPKKVLCLSEDGALAHFSQEGARVYQRQQLAGDDHYVIDPALAIFGLCGAEIDWNPAGWAAVPIQDDGVRVEDLETLGLAQALNSITHQADPGGIDG